MPSRPAGFDTQAETYDQRAGLPEQHCRVIAQAVRQMAAAMPGDLVFEVGAGTGRLGTWLARLPLRYVGIDLSHRMLASLPGGPACPSHRPLLLQADGNDPWPLAEATVRVIFSSRAIHWLDPAHVVDESRRVARPDGASLIIGRIQRPAGSLSTVMQHEMQRLLRQHGYSGRGGELHQHRLLAALQQYGATQLTPVVVVRWTVTRTPEQSIADWESKPGLGGTDLRQAVKRVILDELRIWAQSTFGDLHRQVPCEEAYVLRGVRLRPTA